MGTKLSTTLLPVYVKPCMQLLTIPLPDAERQALGEQLSGLVLSREAEVAKRTLANDAFREAITGLSQSISSVAGTLASGTKTELMDVELRFDFNQGIVRTYRLEAQGGALLAERPMTEAEKQVPLELYLQQGGSLKMPPKPTLALTEGAGNG